MQNRSRREVLELAGLMALSGSEVLFEEPKKSKEFTEFDHNRLSKDEEKRERR